MSDNEKRIRIGIDVGGTFTKAVAVNAAEWTLVLADTIVDNGDDTITIQEDELSLGVWLHRNEITEDHSGISLTGEMIEYFRDHGAPA